VKTQKYKVLKDAPVVGVWKTKGDTVDLAPVTAQTYVRQGVLKELPAKKESTTNKEAK